MVEIITYSLKNDQKRSDGYYQDISDFTDEVLDEIKQHAGAIIEDYQGYIQENKFETARSFAEYALEFLTLLNHLNP